MDKYSQIIAVSSGEFKDELCYWREKLKGEFEMAAIPCDYNNHKVGSYSKDTLNYKFSEQVYKGINKISKGSHHGMYMILLSGVFYMIHRFSGMDDMVVGMPIFRQESSEKYTNSLVPVRACIEGNKTFKEFLSAAKDTIREADKNQSIPFALLVKELGIEISNKGTAFFDTIAALDNIHYVEALKGLECPVEFIFTASESSLAVNMEYNSCLFSKDTIRKFVLCLENYYLFVINNPDVKLSSIDILTESERKRILSDFNNTLCAYPDNKTIHELFEEQAHRTPGNIAVEFEGQSMTYRELSIKSNRLAGALRERGVKRGDIVGLLLDRSVEMILGILGILKAGGACMPIDPEYPKERIDSMICDSNVSVVLSRTGLDNKPDTSKVTIIDVYEALGNGNGYNCENISEPEDLLYVIYTSGSTGKPKGVMIKHKNLVNLISFEFNKMNVDFGKGVLQYTTLCFDVSFQEIFSTLLSGGQLFLIRKEVRDDISGLFNFIKDRNIELVFFPVPLLKLIFSQDEFAVMIPSSVKHIITAGEQLVVTERMKEYLKQKKIHLHNHYGPSETHVVTTFVISPDSDTDELPPIGRPISNTSIFILDKNKNIQPVGVMGELCISGECLGNGYINNPEMTKLKFVPNPYIEGEFMYLTGDIARWLPDGNIQFLGRSDHQVKIRGYRIEPGEIEAKLLSHTMVKEAAVIAKEDKDKNKYLCAYVVTEGKVAPAELREHLLKELPDYMIPSYFVQMDTMPLTSTGKVNRKLLPEPDKTVDAGALYAAPRNEEERKLADIWAKVLGLEKVGIDDEFFMIGGDSIKALRIAGEAARENIQISVKNIFKYKTISKILENSAVETNKAKTAGNDTKNEASDAPDIIEIKDRWPIAKNFRIYEKDVKELKIQLQRDITVYMHRSLSLCVIMADENLHPWFYERFINIFSMVNQEDYLTLDYLEVWAPYREIINEISLGTELLEKEMDIIRFINEKIDMGYYLNIAVDEFYLRGKEKYQKTHFIHHALVYGYDNINRKVKVIGFGAGNVLDRISFDYDNFVEAYEKGKEYYKKSAPWTSRTAVQMFFSNGFDKPYPFNPAKVVRQLHDYLFSKGDDAIIYYWALKQEQITYGFGAYDVIINHLEAFFEGKFSTDYRAIHLLAEHKKVIGQRLQYIIDSYRIDGRLFELCSEYMKVVEAFNELRIKYFDLEYSFSAQALENSAKELGMSLRQVIDMIKSARDKERTLLLEIYELLKDMFGEA